jgi:phosphopantothenate---cysteine ligase (CTP)
VSPRRRTADGSVRCVVTAGPTFEPLDEVRRLTNFSSGRLGTELANHLAARGHQVTLLLGEQATWAGPRRVRRLVRFGTTADLLRQLRACSKGGVDAVFHAAAVSDFTFGRVWRRTASGKLRRVRSGKIGTRQGLLLAELRPTPKIIARLRGWFPRAWLVGWKYEVTGQRRVALARARRQIRENRTDACIANGPAYGKGFGLVRAGGQVAHLAGRGRLLAILEKLLQSQPSEAGSRGAAGLSSSSLRPL